MFLNRGSLRLRVGCRVGPIIFHGLLVIIRHLEMFWPCGGIVVGAWRNLLLLGFAADLKCGMLMTNDLWGQGLDGVGSSCLTGLYLFCLCPYVLSRFGS